MLMSLSIVRLSLADLSALFKNAVGAHGEHNDGQNDNCGDKDCVAVVTVSSPASSIAASTSHFSGHSLQVLVLTLIQDEAH